MSDTGPLGISACRKGLIGLGMWRLSAISGFHVDSKFRTSTKNINLVIKALWY